MAWHAASTAPCYWESCVKRYVGPPTKRGGGVFYQGVSAQIQGNRLRISSRTNTPTYSTQPVALYLCIHPLAEDTPPLLVGGPTYRLTQFSQ